MLFASSSSSRASHANGSSHSSTSEDGDPANGNGGMYNGERIDIWMKDKVFEPITRDPTRWESVGADVPLVIDSGTSRFRAGFAAHDDPYIDEPALVSRYTSRKNVKTLLFGRDTEVDASARVVQKGMHEGEVLLGGDNLEVALDYAFLNLSPLSEALSKPSCSTVPHPILMTERLAQPLHSRQLTSEILFEGYGVPSVTYGVDSLFAFESHWARQAGLLKSKSVKGKGARRERAAAAEKSGLIIDMGNVSTNVIPVLDGCAMMGRAKRIPWGGSQASELMLKLAQLKYPGFPTRVTPAQATYLYHETAYFADDYQKELEKLSKPEGLVAGSKVVQFEYAVPDVVQKSEEELARQAEKRREQGKRLQEMQQKQREEKAREREQHLQQLKEFKASKENMTEEEWQIALEDAEFDDEADLDKTIRTTESAVKKNVKSGDTEEIEEPSFPLLDVPDEELNDEQIKEKRKQRMMKGNYDARMKLRAEKEAERQRLAEIEKADVEARERDPVGWASKLREDHTATIARLKERKKRRAALSDRKSAAAQSRMKSISNLASDTPDKKRRRRNSDDDDFGADDADWAVYREIGGEEEEDAEEDDLAHVKELEEKLLQYDPTFTTEDTLEAQSQRQTALINAFLRGVQKFDPEDLAQSYQVHLNVERVRVPEAWFQPQMVGVDNAGIAEIAGWLLNGFREDERREMTKCIFVTGGSSVIPGLTERLRRELTSILPFRQELNIVTSWPEAPGPEPWRGMASWSYTQEAKRAAVSRNEWQENGGDYIKEHRWSNWADL